MGPPTVTSFRWQGSRFFSFSRPTCLKIPGPHSAHGQASSGDHSRTSHSPVHMEQFSQCQGYQPGRSSSSVQPLPDGGCFLSSSSTSCARQFSSQLFQRESKTHGVQVGSVGQDAVFLGENVAGDSPPESPSHPRQHSGFLLEDNNVRAFMGYENPAVFFEDPSSGLHDHLLQTASFEQPPLSKIRAFPHMNPSRLGLHHCSGSCGYGKSCPESQQVRSNSSTMDVTNSLSQLSQSSLGVVFDQKRGFRHELSDSDVSHSSFGFGCLQRDMMKSHTSQSSFQVGHQGRVVDTLTLKGSVNGTSDSTISVLGSNSVAKYDSEQIGFAKVSPQSSLSSLCPPCHTANIDSNCHRRVASCRRQGTEQTPSTRTHTRRKSEPECANLPLVTQLVTENVTEQWAGNTVGLSNKLCGSVADDKRDVSFSNSSSSPSAKYCNKEFDPSFTHSSVEQNSMGFADEDLETSSVSSSTVVEPCCLVDSASVVQHPGGLEASTRVIGKSKYLDVDDRLVQPRSVVSFSCSDEDLNSSPGKTNGQNQMGIEQFALENFNEHRQGILGKTVPIGNMLNWTKDVISKPMIRTQDKAVKKEAPEVFRLIQMYMSDRKAKSPQIQIALEIAQKGWNVVELRDEIYMQLCRQTTENPKVESLIRGWELMGLCLSVFPPSFRFHSYLEGFFGQNLNLDDSKTLINHFAGHCQRQLERISKSGAKGRRFTLTVDYGEQILRSIFHPSNFGATLEDVMRIQKDRFPDRQLPWIQTTLSEEVLRLNGAQTEGIFRVPGDIDEVNALRTCCDQWSMPSYTDLHALASLLKQWYRELHEPVIPPEFYNECIASCSNPEAAVMVVERLPSINRLVFCYLIRFLQVFAALENSNISKMDASNLATVIAPNCLRCESEDPSIILRNTHKEASFIKVLILNLDTSFMDGIW